MLTIELSSASLSAKPRGVKQCGGFRTKRQFLGEARQEYGDGCMFYDLRRSPVALRKRGRALAEVSVPLRGVASAGGSRVRIRSIDAARWGKRAPCSSKKVPCSSKKVPCSSKPSSLFFGPERRSAARLSRRPHCAGAPAAPVRRRVCYPYATGVKIVGEGRLLCYICSRFGKAHNELFPVCSHAPPARSGSKTHPRSESPSNFPTCSNPLKRLKMAMGKPCNELA